MNRVWFVFGISRESCFSVNSCNMASNMFECVECRCDVMILIVQVDARRWSDSCAKSNSRFWIKSTSSSSCQTRCVRRSPTLSSSTKTAAGPETASAGRHSYSNITSFLTRTLNWAVNVNSFLTDITIRWLAQGWQTSETTRKFFSLPIERHVTSLIRVECCESWRHSCKVRSMVTSSFWLQSIVSLTVCPYSENYILNVCSLLRSGALLKLKNRKQ